MIDPPDDDHAYFQHLERVFIGLRGSPLLLSPKDWHVARGWYRAGIPLDLVEATLHEVFERRRAEGKDGKFLGLRSLKAAVTKAWREWQKHQAAAVAPTEAAGIDVEARVERLAAAVPDRFEDSAGLRARIRAITGDIEHVERDLTALDQELLERAEASLDEAGRARFEAALRATHSALGVRLPAGELARADAPLRRHVLRRELVLPVLSLFAQEAVGDSVQPDDEENG